MVLQHRNILKTHTSIIIVKSNMTNLLLIFANKFEKNPLQVSNFAKEP